MPQDKRPISAPPSFQDGQQRTWTIKLSLSLIDAVQTACQVDLAPRDLKIDPVINLLFDDRQLGSVLWECIKGQAESQQVNRESFFDSLDGEALKNGWGALVDGIVFFTQSKSPKMAASIMEVVEAQMRFVEAGATAMVATLKSKTTDEKLRKKLEQLEKEMQKQVNDALDDSVGLLEE